MSTEKQNEEKPKVGDRVKLIGSHRFAGFEGIYIADRKFWSEGAPIPYVKVIHRGMEVETWVHDAANQMRKA